MDLQNLFTSVLNMTITGSIVIFYVILARVVLKNAPRVYAWMLWLVVIFRLLCPVSVSGPVSVLEFVDAPRTESGAVEYVELPVRAPLETMVAQPGQMVAGEATSPVPVQTKPPVDWNFLASWVWMAGAGLLAVWSMISYVNLKRKLRESVPLGRGIRESDRIASPFVLWRTVYLPAGLGEGERAYILLHERLHIRHADPIVKGLFWLAVCIHWFNPLVWVAFALCGRDMELRCDEAVLKKLGGAVRSDYAQSLLNFATGGNRLAAPLAFGEGDTGKRVKFVLNWKKKKLWVGLAAAVLCMAVLVLTVFNPNAHLVEYQIVFGYQYRAEAVLGEPEPMERIWFLREYDDHLLWQEREVLEDLGELKIKKLGSRFDLADEDLERQLRQENDLAWNCGAYWVLYQKDRSIYLTEGADRVQRLHKILGMRVRPQTAENFGDLHYMYDYPLGSGLWEQYPHDAVAVGSGTTLVFTGAGDAKAITVVEEYHRMNADGSETVIETGNTLERTRDYGYELPISRRGDCDGDWAMYRVDLGMTSYVFFARFGTETLVEQIVTYEEAGVRISLPLPAGWCYAITPLNAAESSSNMAAGITFWPRGREEGKIFFGYYPDLFAVCGTGLETVEMELAGQKATVGTYDGAEVWDFIQFDEHFAVWGQGHEHWWAEYGDTAMEILDSAVFGK